MLTTLSSATSDGFVAWEQLFSATAAQDQNTGNTVVDVTTRTRIVAVYDPMARQMVWSNVWRTLAAVSLQAHRFVTSVASGFAVSTTLAGAPGIGVSLNTADSLQPIYVINQGAALVERANPADGLAANDLVASDGDLLGGRARLALAGEWVLGYVEHPTLVVGGKTFALVQIRAPWKL